ncbi:uncharacterized protein C8R40DRAFT_1016523, partial [Lentinula edodes]|uniref:uncharacterized protein n=1 Tax=Lentinula edodes TaxID=5353 RepID=UPI001E8DC5FA
RRLISRIVNLLSTKLELGSPMISLYLLKNPDHYTSHNFIPFYWKTYVSTARSFFDYTHRPVQHVNYSLYNWVCSFYKVAKRKSKDEVLSDLETESKYSRSAKSTKGLPFLAGHPLVETHVISTRRNSSMTVPNFIGALPRPNKDDREYYCCTMLTLFCPWRTGEDLKKKDQSWHEAFEAYDFCEQSQLYMKNMNIRFECLDARDDFRAQLKSGKL